MTVVTLRQPRRARPPAPPTYAGTITPDERAAAETVLRNAQRLVSILGGPFTTTAAKARLPALIRESRAALDELEGLS